METHKETYKEEMPRVRYAGGMAHLALDGTVAEDGRHVYDCLWVAVTEETEAGVTEGLRARLLSEIAAYDASASVNSFTIDGTPLWLDRATRGALMRRFEAERDGGVDTTTLWFDDRKFTMPVDTAIGLLNKIELYACKCYDTTAQHKAEAAAIDTMDALLAYDYKEGYPEKVEIVTGGDKAPTAQS